MRIFSSAASFHEFRLALSCLKHTAMMAERILRIRSEWNSVISFQELTARRRCRLQRLIRDALAMCHVR